MKAALTKRLKPEKKGKGVAGRTAAEASQPLSNVPEVKPTHQNIQAPKATPIYCHTPSSNPGAPPILQSVD
jgi:hypothetical protein